MDAGPGITLLGMCPVLWKACPLLYFELYSPIYDFDSNSFVHTYCYPHHLRGDDKVVTLLTITRVLPLNSALHPLSTITPPTVPEMLQLLADAYVNLDHFAYVINIPPIHAFTPSHCPYGNTDPASSNHRHRYAIIWKDGVERMLPADIHTPTATFQLSASLEPGNNIPGFWTTEHSNTHSKFYNGMLQALYVSYTTSTRDRRTGDQSYSGIRPSDRWYSYRQNRLPETQSTSSIPKPQAGGGGRRAGGTMNPPGRGHPARPTSTPAGLRTPPPQTPSAPPPSTDITQRSPLTTDQQFAQILALCQTTVMETRGVRTELSNDRETQARINNDLRNSLARAHAAIDALTSTMHK